MNPNSPFCKLGQNTFKRAIYKSKKQNYQRTILYMVENLLFLGGH